MVKVETEPININSQAFENLLESIQADAELRRGQDARLLPTNAIEWIKEAKLGALPLPKELGGSGITNQELFEVIRRIATADPDVAHALRSHFIFVEDNLAAPASAERTRRLQLVADGALVGNATTEISAKPQGSKQYDTTLTKTATGYTLNGRKYFTTGTLYADYVYVLAAGEENRVFVAFIPTNRLGVHSMIGMASGNN